MNNTRTYNKIAEYQHSGATWYIIGVGGAGGNIVNAFFKSLEYKAIRIEPWFSFGRKTKDVYLTDVILKNGVPGIFGWWLYNTALWDLENTEIVHKKLRALYPDSPVKLEVSQKAEEKQNNLAAMKKSQQLIYKQHMIDHFTAGISQVEGAGKRYALGNEVDPLTDIEYFMHKTGRKEPMLQYILDTLENGLWLNTNGLLVIHASARGTGSGATCKITRCLKEIRSDLYVVTLSVLPSIDPEGSRYEDAIAQTTFSLLSMLRDEHEKKLAGAMILASNARLHELSLKKTRPFLYADKFLHIGGVRIFPRLSSKIGRDSYNGILTDLLGLLSATHIEGRQTEAFDLSNLITAVEPPVSGQDFPGILIPCVHISKNSNITTKELIIRALENGGFVKCDPSTSRAMYIILFLNNKVKGNALHEIYAVTNETINNLYPHSKIPTLSTPDYVDTKGKFAAAIVFLINPKIPLIEQMIKSTKQYLEKIEHTPQYAPQSDPVLMLEDWQNFLGKRAEEFLKMLGNNQKEIIKENV